MKKICIIGMGNMGKAIFDFVKSQGDFEVSGCDKEGDIKDCVKKADVILIAVKPQSFAELSDEIESDLSEKLIISIMAGVSVKSISEKLGSDKVVRVMPNLPAKVGRALNGWYASEALNDEEKDFVKAILKSFGTELEVDEESKIDAITALSGSGPAYYYYLNQVMKKAAVDYGFSELEAKKIAANTFLGAAELLDKSEFCSSELKEKVTSKGGTTEAALRKMEEEGFEKVLREGIEAARKRAEELNN